MNVPCIANWCIVASLAALGTHLGLPRAIAAQPGQAGVEEGVQVLTRGPVHEAFAETVTFNPVPGLVVPKTPPAAIEELPPDQKPEGAHVAWIPGYWAWDDERSSFLWVSGVWRALPPGRQWVPGYWGKSAQGSQWTSGYWADAKVSEIAYLSEPPATVEAGPNIASPSPDNIWLPGCWVWQNDRYAWRSGFWASAQPDWDWVPAHYVYTPRGYVFVDGYWDYSVDRRGVLFAPVHFAVDTYTRPGFSYSPVTVIDLGAFVDNLFLRPQYQHYYFGDYYAANYQVAGYYPSYSYYSGRYGYDPIFAHERWQHRRDGLWEQHVAATFENRRDHVDARPVRIWTTPGVIGRGGLVSAVLNLVGASLDQASRDQNDAWRFQVVDETERQRLAQQRQDVYRFRDQRQQWETEPAAVVPAADREPARMKLPPSPIVAKSTDQLGKDYTPPQAHAAPPLDNLVQPKPSVSRSPEQPRLQTTLRVPLDTPRPQSQPQVKQPSPQPRPQPRVDRAVPQPAVGGPSVQPKQDKHEEKAETSK